MNKKIVIVGAGLAGLTAAYRLHAQGMDVALYEAKNRIGGRIFTIHINGQIAELGGLNLADGGQPDHIIRLTQTLGLEIESHYAESSLHYFNDNQLVPVSAFFENRSFNAQTLRETLRRLAENTENMQQVLEHLFDSKDPLHQIMSTRLAAYEGASVEKLSSIYEKTLFYMLLGGMLAAYRENPINRVTIKGGNASLPEALASAVGNRLHANMPLTRVEKGEENAFKLTFLNHEEVFADILILAIPCSVYEHIYFEPGIIPSERLDAIKDIRYGTVAKILVPYSQAPSKKIGCIDHQMISFYDATQNVITLYCTGNASSFSQETVPDIYTQARPMLERGLEQFCPSFSAPVLAEDQNFKAYTTPVGHSWPSDPYAKGGYAYIAPGQEALLTSLTEVRGETFKTLFAPVQQNLYFAGEHASILLDVPGTMEAACESGERVARTIMKR